MEKWSINQASITISNVHAPNNKVLKNKKL